ncbi:MAG: glycosyltransferase family 2 protein [Solirubrobacteraceae bacterium]
MKSSHHVIVAIPTYNRAGSLDRTIRSVLDQDLGTVTALVSDDASSDETEGLCRTHAERDPRVIYHRQPLNLGVTANYNWLVSAALDRDPERTAFFMFLSDDDWLDRDYCRRCVQRLESSADLSLVAGRTALHAESGEVGHDPDINLFAQSGAQRVWDFCQGVVPTGVFAGIMRTGTVSKLPPQRNVLGHDWLFLTNVAYLGKFATEPATRVHRGVDGVSSARFGLAATLGVARLQAVKPLATIGFFLVLECLHRSPVFARLSLLQRVNLAGSIVAGLAVRRIVPLLERQPSRQLERAALNVVSRSRGAVRRFDATRRPADY